MEPLPESTLEEYVQQKLEGKSYSEIRSQLREAGLSDDAVTEAVRQIDDRVLRAEVNRLNRKRSRQIYWAGIILAVAGLLITVSSNGGLFLAGRSKILVYSPFFAGIALMLYARMLQRRQSNPLDQRPGKIRSKRPYK